MIPIYLSINEVQDIDNVAYSTAQRKLARIRAAYKLEKYQPVTIADYAKYNRLELEVLIRLIQLNREKRKPGNLV